MKKEKRLFTISFFTSAILLFAFFGFVLVENSYQRYGLVQEPLYSISTTENGLELSFASRSAHLPKAIWERPIAFVASHEYIFIPRTLRLAAQAVLWVGTK